MNKTVLDSRRKEIGTSTNALAEMIPGELTCG